MKKKRLAYALDEDTATSMVQRSKDDNDMYDCKSFTDDYIWYEFKLKNGHLSSVLTTLMIRNFVSISSWLTE